MQHVAPLTIKMWSKCSCDWRYPPFTLCKKTKQVGHSWTFSFRKENVFFFFF